MRTTVKSVRFKRRTVMVVQRLSIWEVRKLTYSTKERNTGSRKDDGLKSTVYFRGFFSKSHNLFRFHGSAILLCQGKLFR